MQVDIVTDFILQTFSRPQEELFPMATHIAAYGRRG
jgi:hypothetical protein